MKKSQILAAIALAMALGVVAPVVSAENASAADPTPAPTPSTTDAAKAATKEVKAIKASFKDIITYADGTRDESELKGVAAYGFYGTNAETVEKASTMVNDLKRAYDANSIAADIRGDIVGAAGTILGADYTGDIKAIKDILADSNLWGSANLTTTVSSAKKIASELKSSVSEGDTDYEATTKKAEAIEALVTESALTDALNAKILAGATNIQALYGKLVKENTITVNSEATLNAVVAAVKAKMPDLALYNRINKQVAKVEKAIQDGNSDKTINGYLATLKKLVNGEIDQDQADKENEANKPGVDAPATGIAGTAEGTATTVSIVAGLATALTALGAGVVAYRSARRK